MQSFVYLRPASIGEAVQLARQHAEARPLAGGQSLLAAMKLGLNSPTHLIDLQDLPGLQDIRLDADTLHVGAMATHGQMASSALVRGFCPMLADLAAGIADVQVRAVGTIGGALANNDPAACWPAGVLALNATLVTDRRAIAADDFFQGLYATALQPGELLLAVRFAQPSAAHYRKHEQPASRFAMVGLAVSRQAADAGGTVRVAVTGLGHGVRRWIAAEQALSVHWSLAALADLALPEADALGDVHASAAYRAHLAGVLCRRGVAALTGESSPRGLRRFVPPVAERLGGGPADPAVPGTTLMGTHLLPLPLATVWAGILDPEVLRLCIPGCESLQARDAHRFEATIKIGIGPVSARFQTSFALSDLQPPHGDSGAGCLLEFEGRAGGLGHGQGSTRVRLAASGTNTRLDWQARTQVSGRIAQFGNRLIEATARKLSAEFFARFAAVLAHADGVPPPAPKRQTPPHSLFQKLLASLERFLHALFRR